MYGLSLVTTIPGLNGELTTTKDADVVFTSSGGITNASAVVGDCVRVNIRLVVDGAVVMDRDYDVEKGKYASTVNWNFSVSKNLSPGVHQVRVDALLRWANEVSMPAQIAGGENDPKRGILTAVVLNR